MRLTILIPFLVTGCGMHRDLNHYPIGVTMAASTTPWSELTTRQVSELSEQQIAEYRERAIMEAGLTLVTEAATVPVPKRPPLTVYHAVQVAGRTVVTLRDAGLARRVADAISDAIMTQVAPDDLVERRYPSGSWTRQYMYPEDVTSATVHPIEEYPGNAESAIGDTLKAIDNAEKLNREAQEAFRKARNEQADATAGIDEDIAAACRSRVTMAGLKAEWEQYQRVADNTDEALKFFLLRKGCGESTVLSLTDWFPELASLRKAFEVHKARANRNIALADLTEEAEACHPDD